MTNPLMIIPSYLKTNTHAKVLFKCVGTLRDSTDSDILIIDDGSPVKDKEKFYKELAEWVENVDVEIKEQNSGFSKSINIGLRKALLEKRDACLINADIEFKEHGWLEELQKTDGDIIGARLFYPNLLIQHAGIYWSKYLRTFDHRFRGAPPNLPAVEVPCECPVTGALQYIKYHVLEDIGLYDESFPLGFEDVDYCIQAIQADYKCVYNPDVKAIHHESLFRGDINDKALKKKEKESWLAFLTKYRETDFYGLLPGEVK